MPATSIRRVPSTNGVQLALHDLGGGGPTLLFAHATGFHGWVWSPIAERLADTYHCLAIDFRAHGDSTPPDDLSFDWEGFGDDVEAVLDSLDATGPLYGVGHSMGGAALLLAEQRRPGTFTKLYCFEPIVIDTRGRSVPVGIDDHPLAVGARRRRETFGSLAEALENYRSKPPLNSIAPEALQAYVRHGFDELPDGSVRLKCRGEHEAAVYYMSTTNDVFEHLAKVRCPVVIAAGPAHDGGPGAFAAPIAEALPAGTFERHDHLGHFGPLEQPGFVAAEIRRAFRT